MTTHRAVNISERSLLPRGLLARRSFRFSIGQAVTFHDVPAVITDRSHSSKGQELYGIAIECADRPHRVARGEYLKPYDLPAASAMLMAA